MFVGLLNVISLVFYEHRIIFVFGPTVSIYNIIKKILFSQLKLMEVIFNHFGKYYNKSVTFIKYSITCLMNFN